MVPDLSNQRGSQSNRSANRSKTQRLRDKKLGEEGDGDLNAIDLGSYESDYVSEISSTESRRAYRI